MLDQFLLLRARHHVDAELLEHHVEDDNGNDEEPEDVPAGEQAAFFWSFVSHEGWVWEFGLRVKGRELRRYVSEPGGGRTGIFGIRGLPGFVIGRTADKSISFVVLALL